MQANFPGAERLVPVMFAVITFAVITFAVITGTVAIYGLLSAPLARWLRLRMILRLEDMGGGAR